VEGAKLGAQATVCSTALWRGSSFHCARNIESSWEGDFEEHNAQQTPTPLPPGLDAVEWVIEAKGPPASAPGRGGSLQAGEAEHTPCRLSTPWRVVNYQHLRIILSLPAGGKVAGAGHPGASWTSRGFAPMTCAY
jgi:hypothetical protein